MAQSLASTPLDIYNALTASAGFMSHVGTYTFVDGSSLPSIVINTPGTDLPQVQAQSGLEVIIHDIGNMQPQQYITNASDPVFSWPVFLIVWAPATGDHLRQALVDLISIFPGASSIDTVTTGVILGASLQTQVLIPSNTPLILP